MAEPRWSASSSRPTAGRTTFARRSRASSRRTYRTGRSSSHDDGGSAANRAVVASGSRDPRIAYHVNPRRLGHRRQQVLGLAGRGPGRYVANLDDDDSGSRTSSARLVPDPRGRPVARHRVRVARDHRRRQGMVDLAATAANERATAAASAPGRHAALDRLVLVDQAIPLTMGSVIRRSAVDW